jgi:hypothetical protein
VEQTRRQGDGLNDEWITRFPEIAAVKNLDAPPRRQAL